MLKQVGELIREDKRYSFILADPKFAEVIERGKRRFQEGEKKEDIKKKRPSGFKKTFEQYVGKGVQKKLF